MLVSCPVSIKPFIQFIHCQKQRREDQQESAPFKESGPPQHLTIGNTRKTLKGMSHDTQINSEQRTRHKADI